MSKQTKSPLLFPSPSPPSFPPSLPPYLPHTRAHIVSLIALHMSGLHRHVAIGTVGLGDGEDDGVVAGVDPSGGCQEVHVGIGGSRLCVLKKEIEERRDGECLRREEEEAKRTGIEEKMREAEREGGCVQKEEAYGP